MKSIASALVTILAAIAIGCDQNQAEPAHGPNTAGTRRPAVTNAFRLFSTPAEHMPGAMRSHLARLLSRHSPRHFQPTVEQREEVVGGAAWAFVDRGAVCLAQDGIGAVACSKARHARSAGVSLGVFSPPSGGERPHDFLLIGLAPDGVRRVAITIGKRHQTIDVQNNLFSASGEDPVLIKRFIRGAR